MQKVTNLGHFLRNRLPSAQNVPLCAVQCGQGGTQLRCPGWLLAVLGSGPSRVRQWLARATPAGGMGVGAGASLHILSGVLVGVVAWFQRFPALGERPGTG